MLHFTLKTKTEDYGLSYETIEELHIETVGVLTAYYANNDSKVTMQGKDAQNKSGAMLECLEFINNSQRNSKNLKVSSVDFKEGYAITKGMVNFDRFVWGALWI